MVDRQRCLQLHARIRLASQYTCMLVLVVMRPLICHRANNPDFCVRDDFTHCSLHVDCSPLNEKMIF